MPCTRCLRQPRDSFEESAYATRIGHSATKVARPNPMSRLKALPRAERSCTGLVFGHCWCLASSSNMETFWKRKKKPIRTEWECTCIHADARVLYWRTQHPRSRGASGGDAEKHTKCLLNLCTRPLHGEARKQRST